MSLFGQGWLGDPIPGFALQSLAWKVWSCIARASMAQQLWDLYNFSAAASCAARLAEHSTE